MAFAEVLQALKRKLNLPKEYSEIILPPSLHNKALPANFPQAGDLVDGALIAIGITILRLVLVTLILSPLARWSMKHRYYKTPRIPKLDEAFRENPVPAPTERESLGALVNMSGDHVGDYFRRRRNGEKENKALYKFVEVAWRLCTHVTVTSWGLYNVLTLPYLFERASCWGGWPDVQIPATIYWYYMTELGIYLQEFFFHFTESRKSDFVEMVIHHIATLILISGSYICNFFAVGFLVMVVHDAADSLLELAKLFNYVSRARPWAQKVTDLLFILFALTFFGTRLVVFPFVVFWRSLQDSYAVVGPAKALDFLHGFLGVLVCLHIFWMSLILRMAIKMAASGTTEKDERSDDECFLEASIMGAAWGNSEGDQGGPPQEQEDELDKKRN